MFLPTITYGFAIIYSFGKQGLITRLLGHQIFNIYGFGGLLLGYVIDVYKRQVSSWSRPRWDCISMKIQWAF